MGKKGSFDVDNFILKAEYSTDGINYEVLGQCKTEGKYQYSYNNSYSELVFGNMYRNFQFKNGIIDLSSCYIKNDNALIGGIK